MILELISWLLISSLKAQDLPKKKKELKNTLLVSNTKNYNKIQGIKKLIQYRLDWAQLE